MFKSKMYIVIILYFILVSCTGNKDLKARREFISQPISTAQKSLEAKIATLVYSDSNTPTINNYLTTNNVKKVSFVNDTQFLDPKEKFKFSEKLLLEQLKLAYPNPDSQGVAYIDLEAPYLTYLMDSNINSIEFKKSKKLFIDVLLFVKKNRPNVRWGYYYFPFTTFWDRTKDFYDKDNRVKEIIENSDVMFPSIYIFYNNVNFKLENKAYLIENTEQVIRIGKKYNKLVYPMIMSRYHPSNSKIGNEMIEKDNLKFYINTILETRFEGKALDGLMLWNADGYAHRIKEKKITAELTTTKMNFEQYYDRHLMEVLDIMLGKNKK